MAVLDPYHLRKAAPQSLACVRLFGDCWWLLTIPCGGIVPTCHDITGMTTIFVVSSLSGIHQILAIILFLISPLTLLRQSENQNLKNLQRIHNHTKFQSYFLFAWCLWKYWHYVIVICPTEQCKLYKSQWWKNALVSSNCFIVSQIEAYLISTPNFTSTYFYPFDWFILISFNNWI